MGSSTRRTFEAMSSMHDLQSCSSTHIPSGKYARSTKYRRYLVGSMRTESSGWNRARPKLTPAVRALSKAVAHNLFDIMEMPAWAVRFREAACAVKLPKNARSLSAQESRSSAVGSSPGSVFRRFQVRITWCAVKGEGS